MMSPLNFKEKIKLELLRLIAYTLVNFHANPRDLMTQIKISLQSSLSAFFIAASLPLLAFQVDVVSSNGEACVLEFAPEESFESVMQMVNQCMVNESGSECALSVEIVQDDGKLSVKAFEIAKAVPRDYYAAVTPQERKDLVYILRTLANSSLAKIAKERSSLKKAGDRIDNLHPFKFIETVFMDEELKVCIRNIQGKSWVWDEYRNGITSSLAKESAVNNLKPEYIQSLANNLQIDVNLIIPTIQDKNWSKLVTDLITIVPRSGESNRYNM